MSLQGFYTTQGLALAAKIAAGTKLTVTKVTAGSGTTAAGDSVLAGTKQTLTVGEAAVSAQTAALPVTLAEAKATASYTLTELGVYASDPDAGEILYQVFRLDEARAITAGGENVYRFYLQETVGAAGVTVTCSSAGLLVDEDLAPTRSKVLAQSALPRAVTVSAEELRAYMLSLPRMLTEKLTINVTGTTTDLIWIEGFYGPGSIEIAGTAGSTNLNGGVLVLGCAVMVYIHHCNIRPSSESTSRCVRVQNSSGCVWLTQCQLIGNGSSRGFDSSYSATAHLEYVALTNHQIAVLAGQSSVISVAVNDEGQPSGNSIGAYVWWGGIILLAAKAPELLGGTSNVKSGGIIAKADGTLL